MYIRYGITVNGMKVYKRIGKPIRRSKNDRIRYMRRLIKRGE